jgi:cytochrome b
MATTASDTQASSVKVWDLAVRIFHWSLVANFSLAWLTADAWDELHIWTGYAVAALITFRLVWGFIGPSYARFGQFVRAPRHTLTYLRDVLRGGGRRHVGHNPLGAAMVVALLAALAGICLTGWMQTTNVYWGGEWVEETHELLANLLLILVGGHVLGVIYESRHHRENLVRAMITGRKRAPEPGDAT